ncbi:hypothetical protein M378DRAFT_13630 [Amanita muscaria Koide BX008]|uniref:Uncharacterized protein n=1 Tax=Amanita muscaria (strain Koide BX008) TaxID=946122 RepID=A0A0C2WI60_AMAMK|nr:hypothetical protein M378DRAFT_13630 [Amanita muscaria Koide BX008]
MVKGKASKSDTGQKANALGPPTIQVDKTLPELPREESFGRRTKAKMQGFLSNNNLVLIRRTLCRDRFAIKIGAIDREAVQVAVKEAEQKVEAMNTMGGGLQKGADLGPQAGTTFDTVYKASNILDPLKVFDSVVKGLGDVHPYVKVALSVLSWASQVCINIADFSSKR